MRPLYKVIGKRGAQHRYEGVIFNIGSNLAHVPFFDEMRPFFKDVAMTLMEGIDTDYAASIDMALKLGVDVYIPDNFSFRLEIEVEDDGRAKIEKDASALGVVIFLRSLRKGIDMKLPKGVPEYLAEQLEKMIYGDAD